MKLLREQARVRRHRRLRKKVAGVPSKPRMAVFRSHKHLYVQLINDMTNTTILGCSTKSETLRKQQPRGGNVPAAEALGKWIAAEATKRGITQVVFDRGGYEFHGRIKAVAEAARQGGLKF
jgi:large subunit ribosomal protein L18